MKNLILVSILIACQSAFANFILIPHNEFTKLSEDKQIYYVKELRSAVLTLRNGTNKTVFFKNEDTLIQLFINSAVASSSNNECVVTGRKGVRDSSGRCIRGTNSGPIMTCSPDRVGAENTFACPTATYGYDSQGNVKCAPSMDKCADKTASKPTSQCVLLGDIYPMDLATETCGGKMGIEARIVLNLSCNPDKVGVENKYPCTPIQIYGYDQNGGAVCVSANPRSKNSAERSRYLEECHRSAMKYPVTAKHAAQVIADNPNNYIQLDAAIKRRCTKNRNGEKNCSRTMIALQDAALYVGAPKLSEPVFDPKNRPPR